MSTKIILLIMFFLVSWMTPTALADVSFTSSVDILEHSVNLTISEKYTVLDAESLRMDLDIDGSGLVDGNELEIFESNFIANRSDQFLGYLEIDGNASSTWLESVDISFQNAQGDVDEDELFVRTVVIYEFDQSLSSGEHDVLILGHPLIDHMQIILPEGMSPISFDGLDNSSLISENGRMVLEGASGVRSFMVGEKPTFEYAVFIEMYREPFYKKAFFLPLLILVEILLASLGLYIFKMNKIK
ncbi:hypothetical protein V7O66_01710 [Methanolobus sp. ZRKC3]|uniref:hypothetical protein n=1 Tax=Methanolobus sp. ZRKC3 TaxID=3125786 RepID=UPI0032513CB6